jgi:peptide/nickel transport system substrate-binding protein/oligopeptide transport system substrate-binding protein
VIDGKATQASGLRALDDRTLEVRLARVDPTFLMEIALPFAIPVPRRWVAQQGERIRDTPLCSGPFRVARWQEGTQFIYEKNPHYWDAASIHLDRVVVDLQVDRDTGTLRFLRGEVDSMERLPSDKLLMFMRSPAWQPYVHVDSTMSSYGELMDTTKPPFNEKKVRQAMNYAINKQDTVVLYNGRATIAHGVLPPGLPGRDEALQPYPYDPAKARALLAEAGYPDGFDVVYSTTPDEIAEKVAQSLQSDLADVGIRVRIQLLTFPAYLTAAGRRDLQFAYTAWIMDFPDPWNFMELKFHSRAISEVNASNESGFDNEEFDALLDAARGEPDHEKRMAMYRRAEHILYDECPWVWHYHPKTTEVVQPYVKNYAWHPVYTRDYRYAWLDRVRP